MHDIKWIREHADEFARGLRRRGMPQADCEALIDDLMSLDERRRAAIAKLEAAQARRNAASKEIGQVKANKDEAAAQALMAEVTELKSTIPAMEAEEKTLSKELDDALAQIPNLPADDVPDGADAEANVERHRFGVKEAPPDYRTVRRMCSIEWKARSDRPAKGDGVKAWQDFLREFVKKSGYVRKRGRRSYIPAPKQHFELGEGLHQMDFALAAKLSGARFVVLKKALARMERALAQFMLDLHTTEHGYTEVAPPILVRDEAMFGTAQLPKFRDDQFISFARGQLNMESIMHGGLYSEDDPNWPELLNVVEQFLSSSKTGDYPDQEYRVLDFRNIVLQALNASDVRSRWWLIPTAEVPLTNLVRESILDEAELPLRYTACTPCFRAEAGAAGKDTRGMIRQHQFTKVELVSITTPEHSRDEHERMLACAEEVLRRLDLHYRVVTLSTGDMGFAAEKTYDIEVWLPGQGAYREISSCSNCGAFQARRMSARYRTKEGVRHVHTLNGSGVAVGRALIAVMETYQQDNGAIAVPDVLRPYMGGMKVIE